MEMNADKPKNTDKSRQEYSKTQASMQISQ